MLKMLRNLTQDKSGATAIEYGLIVAMIVIAMIVSLEGVATESTGLWTVITEKSSEAINGVRT